MSAGHKTRWMFGKSSWANPNFACAMSNTRFTSTKFPPDIRTYQRANHLLYKLNQGRTIRALGGMQDLEPSRYYETECCRHVEMMLPSFIASFLFKAAFSPGYSDSSGGSLTWKVDTAWPRRPQPIENGPSTKLALPIHQQAPDGRLSPNLKREINRLFVE